MRAEATSLSVILLVALALRLGHALEEQRRIPHVVLANVPFQYETGAIAYALAAGRGFGSPFHVETGPTAWTTPVYPLLLAGIFELLGALTFHAFVAAAFLNILFSQAHLRARFLCGQTDWRTHRRPASCEGSRAWP